MTWYEATRHTSPASGYWTETDREARQDDGGSREIGVTERYAHLRADLFPAGDREVLAIDLNGHAVQYGYKMEPLAR
jgi:hypothetical protein